MPYSTCYLLVQLIIGELKLEHKRFFLFLCVRQLVLIKTINILKIINKILA